MDTLTGIETFPQVVESGSWMPTGRSPGSLYSLPKTLIKRCCLIFALFFMVPAHAGTAQSADVVFQPLATVTNDRNADLQSLGVLLDAGHVVGLRFDTINGRNPHESNFSITDMKRGAVLDGDAKHEAIVLRGTIDSTGGKADLVVTYLSNGLFGTRKDCGADLVRDEKGQWHIVNVYDHRQVEHLVVQTWALGISTIEGICSR